MAKIGFGVFLSLLKINTNKDWNGYKISNLGEPEDDDDMARLTDIENPVFDIDMDSNRITNLAEPTDSSDIARLIDIKVKPIIT